ncbi:MAG: PIN domain-containing protein [Candidatus Methanoperedens sp.]
MERTLIDIESKTSTFVDSNIFTYFLLEDRRYFNKVKAFFDGINTGEIFGFANNIVFTETLFNFVKAEVIISENIRVKDFIKIAKLHPDIIANVDISPVLELFNLPNFYMLDLPSGAISDIKEMHSMYGLLSNDAYHLLTMKFFGITDITTNDSDFDRVDWIKVWKP